MGRPRKDGTTSKKSIKSLDGYVSQVRLLPSNHLIWRNGSKFILTTEDGTIIAQSDNPLDFDEIIFK